MTLRQLQGLICHVIQLYRQIVGKAPVHVLIPHEDVVGRNIELGGHLHDLWPCEPSAGQRLHVAPEVGEFWLRAELGRPRWGGDCKADFQPALR